MLRSAIAQLNRRLRTYDAAGGIGSTALGILGRLIRMRSASASELAELERLQPQSVTRALRSLEEAKLIERKADRADRRRAAIAITPKGDQMLRSAMRSRVEWLGAAWQTLTPDERTLLRDAARLMLRLSACGPD